MQGNVEQMMQILASYALMIVVVMFVLFAIAEVVIPMNKNHGRLGFRWFTNVMLMFFTLGIYKLLGPVFAILSALLADHLGLGLFNRVELSLPLVVLSGIVLIDFKQYWFHRLMHYFDALWRIHRVHHSDIEIDLTTGFRFHPVEAVLSVLFDLVLIAVFGIPAGVILLRYLLVFFFNFFSHGNIHIPAALDRVLKWALVTPSMHHLHHALNKRAANSNFGVFFSFWDRLFGTYMSEYPQTEKGEGEPGFAYGIREYREAGSLNLWLLTLMPFKAETTDQEDTSSDS